MKFVSKSVPLSQIDLADREFAWRYRDPTEKEVSEFAQSLLESGLLNPPVIRKKDDAYQVVCGFRRLTAAKSLAAREKSWSVVLCRVIEGASDAELVQISLDENRCRRGVSPLEMALTIDRLVRERGSTYEEVADRLHVHPKKIQRFRRLLKAIEPVKDALHEGRISFKHATLLAGLPADEQRDLLCQAIDAGLSAAELRRLRRTAKREGQDELEWLKDLSERFPGKLTVDRDGRLEIRVKVDAREGPDGLLAMINRVEAVVLGGHRPKRSTKE